MKFLKAIGWAFGYVKDHFGLITDALGIAKTIAALTPTRSDDEITAAAAKFGQTAGAWLDLPPADRWHALLGIATKALEAKYPNLPLNRIVTAVTLAVSMLKG